MADNLHTANGEQSAGKPPVLSVQVLLPDAINRRLERRSENLMGASWPSWGGHVTLVPAFLPLGSLDTIQKVIADVCLDAAPFTVRFGEPVAVPDVTRPDYFAVLLNVEDVAPASSAPTAEAVTPAVAPASATVDSATVDDEARAASPPSALGALRARLLAVLQPLRQDLHPQLVEQRFMPHVTLALGSGEVEARTLVRHLRAEPIVAEFVVEVLWLLVHISGESARVERYPMPLGRMLASKISKE